MIIGSLFAVDLDDKFLHCHIARRVLNVEFVVSDRDHVVPRRVFSEDVLREQMNGDIVLWEDIATVRVWERSQLPLDAIAFEGLLCLLVRASEGVRCGWRWSRDLV